MTSVVGHDLTGVWIVRDGRRAVVRRTKTPVAPFHAEFPGGEHIYITAEGNGYNRREECDLMDRVRHVVSDRGA